MYAYEKFTGQTHYKLIHNLMYEKLTAFQI